jgi:hypothetical protein
MNNLNIPKKNQIKIIMNYCNLIVKTTIKNKNVHEIIKFFRSIDENASVLLILHIPNGGSTDDCSRIINAMLNHKGKITVFVPEVAISTGAQIALSGDKLIMGKNACLSPFDDQLDDIPANEIIKIKDALTTKSKKCGVLKHLMLSMEDYANILESEKMLKLTEKEITISLKRKYGKKKIKKILDKFLYHKKYHACPLFANDLKGIGIKVKTNVPQELYDYFDEQYDSIVSKKNNEQVKKIIV